MKILFWIIYSIILAGCMFYGIRDKDIVGCLMSFVMILGILPLFIGLKK